MSSIGCASCLIVNSSDAPEELFSAWRELREIEKAGLIRHGQPSRPLHRKVGSILVANSGQNAGFYPLSRFIHTVEVVGSNPAVPTNIFNNLAL
jgi:hypothetical protein